MRKKSVHTQGPNFRDKRGKQNFKDNFITSTSKINEPEMNFMATLVWILEEF